MMIRDMFAEDINRSINGVIKVDQDTTDVIEQEVREYVITKELKKHFISFFDYYSDAFDNPTDDIGVWISGFFGSGKSHFLKMLSYILENRQVGDTSTVEMFRRKFEDDPATFMMIDRATRRSAETILFNIDIEGSMIKDKTAVLRVFAKMFYKHLGFYGEDLKIAMLEKYIDQLGKTEEFRRIFEEKMGKPWVEQRKVLAFIGKYVVPTLMEVLDISESDATNWFKDKTAVEFSIAQLVDDIKEYVEDKPDDFRLLFMIDEVGQYVGTDTDMLLNLQSLTEKIGSECGGKVWIMCTGQEAIDEIIKVRADEFSRIQARFKTRLSLSSSSVDEVIQKRILKKTDDSETLLSELYEENDSVLRNLFSFTDAILDIKGYNGSQEFVANFPFVPYQFIIMQKVFAEIRKHGNSGKHLSGGERSMLSGFQEAAQRVQERDEYTLVPFFMFYDTVHSFLDSSIRRVVERCERAAEQGHGVKTNDVDVLKLLYLVRYIDDIPANLDNIVILMADDLRSDKITMREKVRESLNRLQGQNYIGRSGDTYNFLTDEEQDIQREIKNTDVDTAAIVERIGQLIFSDIYETKKYKYGKYDFDFDKMIDGYSVGAVTGGMKLRFLTVATDAVEKSELSLMTSSKGQAIVVLSESPYFENLENAMKIRKYVKGRNVPQLPQSVQDIIRKQQSEAGKYESDAKDLLKKAIESAEYYVDGEHLEVKSGDAKNRIDQALEYLVSNVYSELDLITKNAESDADILEILNGSEIMISGTESNRGAAAKVEEYLEMQDRMNLPTSMFDVQTRYQSIPYGWREIDIAAVVAQLMYQQKVTIKYGGTTIQPDNAKLPDMLRKKSEIGKTKISKRKTLSAAKMNAVRSLLREYFDLMDVPNDEDSLVSFIIEKFSEQKRHYQELDDKYRTKANYPDHKLVLQAIELMTDVLSQQKDNIALIDRVLKREEDLFDSKDDLQNVEGFFKNQVQIFDKAVNMVNSLRDEQDYLSGEQDINDALNQIRMITMGQGKFDYKKIPTLNDLMQIVKEGHERLLVIKRDEILELITQCMGAIHAAAGDKYEAKQEVSSADAFFDQKREQIRSMTSLALLDGLVPPMLRKKDQSCAYIEKITKPKDPEPVKPKTLKPADRTEEKPQPKKVIKSYNRQIIFPAKTLESEADIDQYVENIRESLKMYLKNSDGIRLK